MALQEDAEEIIIKPRLEAVMKAARSLCVSGVAESRIYPVDADMNFRNATIAKHATFADYRLIFKKGSERLPATDASTTKMRLIAVSDHSSQISPPRRAEATLTPTVAATSTVAVFAKLILWLMRATVGTPPEAGWRALHFLLGTGSRSCAAAWHREKHSITVDCSPAIAL